MFVTYALEDPRDNAVFYVGMTNDLYQRYMQHIRCEENNGGKNARILDLRAHGLLPLPRTLATHSTRQAARESEVYWLDHYTHIGAPLTNAYVGAVSSPVQEQAVSYSEMKPVLLKTYRLNEQEMTAFIAAYKASGSIDKSLSAIGRGGRYKKHASELVKVHNLRKEA